MIEKSGTMADNNPLVTIAIPTYNRADGYLKEALQSAISQSYDNIEIIVADNCSIDDTESLVKRYSDPRLRYYKQNKNIGPLNNFNFCVDQAKGAYFLMLHDDDMIDEDFVESCMVAANYRTDLGIIRTGIRLIDSHGEVIHEFPNSVIGLPFEQFILGWFKHKTALYLTSTLYNTKELRAIGGFRSKLDLTPDGVATVRLAAEFERSDIEESKASFRKHSGELTFAVKVKDWGKDFLYLLDLICNVAKKDKALLRSEGERFFANLSYNRVKAIQSPFQKYITYWIVYKMFHYKLLPPPIRQFLQKIS